MQTRKIKTEMARASALLLVMCSVFFTTPSLAGGHTVSGGEAFYTAFDDLRVLDAMEYQDEFIPAELPAYRQKIQYRFASLATKLPKTAAYLTRFLTKIPEPRWYFSAYTLKPVHDRGRSPLLLTHHQKRQIAVNLGDEIFIQKPLWEQLTVDDQAFLLVHESLWNAVGRDYTRDAEVIRRLTGRLLSRYHYLTTTEDLAGELKAIILNPSSPLYKIVDEDLANVVQVPSTPSESNLERFLDFCQNNSSRDARYTLQVLGLYATAVNSLELTRDNCLHIFRYGKNRNSLVMNNENISDLSPFKFFNQLVELDLNGNMVIDLAPLSNMKNLRKLNLSFNKINRLTGLENLVNLRELNLSHNQIESFATLRSPNLERLNLSENFINEGILNFPQLPRLVVLDLSKNQISDLNGLTLDRTPALKELKLRSNTIIQIGQIGRFPGLVVLDLAENELMSVGGLKVLSDVDSIDLSHNKISNLVMGDLPVSLSVLNVSNNPILSVMGADINGSMVKSLAMSKTKLQSLEFLASGDFSKLENLDVRENNITAIEIPPTVVRLTKLDCTDCQVDTISQRETNESLKTLILRNNNVKSFAGLAKFPKLTQLDLYQNQVSTVIGVRSMPFLTYLNLAGNTELFTQGSEIGDPRNIVGKRLFDLGYLYDLETLYVGAGWSTSALSRCVDGVLYCPLKNLVVAHANSAGKNIVLKVNP